MNLKPKAARAAATEAAVPPFYPLLRSLEKGQLLLIPEVIDYLMLSELGKSAFRWMAGAVISGEPSCGAMATSRAWRNAMVRAQSERVAAAVGEFSEMPRCGKGGSGERPMHAPGGTHSSASHCGSVSVKNWATFCRFMPWGTFLDEGASKKVYQVVNACHTESRTEWVQEAVSVMDVQKMSEDGAGLVVQQELRVSFLVSSLVRRGLCPNFVETFEVFGADFGPSPELWGSAASKSPHGHAPPPYSPLQSEASTTAPAVTPGGGSTGVLRAHHAAAVKALHQWAGGGVERVRAGASHPKQRHLYIRMELCTQGDVEHFICAQPGHMLNDDAVVAFAFQIIFALYVGQREFSLRHYDLKLLNVFLKEAPPGGSHSSSSSLGGELSSEFNSRVICDVPGQAFRFTLPSASGLASRGLCAKLGDFGTADVSLSTLGAPVGLEQFTTLENTPIEQLLLGTGATQAYAADTWALGLCLLHLSTGHAPYEELMVAVACPDALREALDAVWADPALAPRYGVVAAAAGLDLGRVRTGRAPRLLLNRTFADTLYRYLVLCGLPARGLVDAISDWAHNPVLRACFQCLRCTAELPASLQHLRSSNSGGTGLYKPVKGPTKAMAHKMEAEFEEHRSQWAINHGVAPVMALARQRLTATGGLSLLQSMLTFVPHERPSMLEALKSPFFESLRCNKQNSAVDSAEGATAAAQVAAVLRLAPPPTLPASDHGDLELPAAMSGDGTSGAAAYVLAAGAAPVPPPPVKAAPAAAPAAAFHSANLAAEPAADEAISAASSLAQPGEALQARNARRGRVVVNLLACACALLAMFVYCFYIWALFSI